MITYEIIVQGHIDSRRARWLDGLTAEHLPSGATRLTGPIYDQAALHGILARIRDLGLTLVSIKQLDDGGDPHD